MQHGSRLAGTLAGLQFGLAGCCSELVPVLRALVGGGLVGGGGHGKRGKSSSSEQWPNTVLRASCGTCAAGSFWLNPPLPMDAQGNWVNPPQRPAEFMDVDPL